MDRVKRIWYLSPMRAAKVQASLRIRAVSPQPPLLAHTSSESRGTFRQKARSVAPLNGWVCAVKICHDGVLEDTNSLDGPQMPNEFLVFQALFELFAVSVCFRALEYCLLLREIMLFLSRSFSIHLINPLNSLHLHHTGTLSSAALFKVSPLPSGIPFPWPAYPMNLRQYISVESRKKLFFWQYWVLGSSL